VTTISNLPEETRAELLARLKRIEGQARGIQKMFEDGRECTSIIDQVASIKAAVNSLSGEMLEAYAVHCITNAASLESPRQEIEDAVRVIVRAGR
jgi:DNA-binding FrmR family transcriptional regulator